jgi:alpha-galactosidase
MPKNNDLRITLIGAGSVSFGLSTLGDLMTKGYDALAGSTIVLHDIVEANLKRTGGVLRKAMDEAGEEGETPPFKIETTTNLKDAVRDANYVIMSIEHGNRMKTWEQDYYIPRKYGSRQIYGENGGPGGAFHTWRQVPPMLTIAHTMEDLCKDAWLFNFSNPLPRVQRALTMATKVKTIGLCHGVGAGLNVLPAIVGCPVANLDVISAGLNHFYWILKVNAKKGYQMEPLGPHPMETITDGQDLIPLIRKRGPYWAKSHELPLIEEFFNIYGYLTYPGQSHPGEYVYWADSYAASVKYDFQGYAAKGQAEKDRLDRTIRGEESNMWWVHQSGERAIDILLGIENDTGQHERAINLPNRGAISNLPEGTVVETPATVDKQGIHPISIGNLPDGIAQILQHEAAVQELVAKAAVSGDRGTALQALILDGTLPSPMVARYLLAEMLELQKEYLPQFHRDL